MFFLLFSFDNGNRLLLFTDEILKPMTITVNSSWASKLFARWNRIGLSTGSDRSWLPTMVTGILGILIAANHSLPLNPIPMMMLWW